MDLLIVESPTKAKTISRFLGGKFDVLSTMGHIRDLPTKKLGIEIKDKPKTQKAKGKSNEYEFVLDYEILPKKKEVVGKLKKAMGQAGTIYLATDPDREGEAIAYHTAVIGGKAKYKRVVFHEITQEAIEEALSCPGDLNQKLVDAQQARRVLDRLVGYKLSPLLWQKIRRGLSAGRVQSVAVRLVVDKEREIEKFVPVEYWDILANLRQADKKGFVFEAKLVGKNDKKFAVDNKSQADQVVADLRVSDFSVKSVEEKKIEQRPLPPFTTSTLQQAAARRFGFTSKRTMRVAQSLYEKGLITYHRTDSFSLAIKAIEAARAYINKNYKENLPNSPNFYKTKSKVAQEAHEAIRPTNFNVTGTTNDFENNDERKLYELIWRRTLACQMKPAIWDQLKVKIDGTKTETYNFEVVGKTIDFLGWLALYQIGPKAIEEDGDIRLPRLDKGERLDLVNLSSLQKFTQPPARFSEASLIKELEKRGIGRPSTYAPIISTIQDRMYVEKTEGRFKPTVLGVTVNDFLVEHFPDIFEYAFTAKMEDQLDEIANGDLQWQPMVSSFWSPFSGKLEKVAKNAKRSAVPVEKTGEKCPLCKEGDLVIRVGRFGKFISCSRFPECKHTAPYIEKINIKCPDCGGDVVIKRTKRGKQFFGCSNYPKCKWASWHKPKEPVSTMVAEG